MWSIFDFHVVEMSSWLILSTASLPCLSHVGVDVKKHTSCQNDQASVNPVILKHTTLVLVMHNSNKNQYILPYSCSQYLQNTLVCSPLAHCKLKITEILLPHAFGLHYSASWPVNTSNGKSSKNVLILHHRTSKVVNLI